MKLFYPCCPVCFPTLSWQKKASFISWNLWVIKLRFNEEKGLPNMALLGGGKVGTRMYIFRIMFKYLLCQPHAPQHLRSVQSHLFLWAGQRENPLASTLSNTSRTWDHSLRCLCLCWPRTSSFSPPFHTLFQLRFISIQLVFSKWLHYIQPQGNRRPGRCSTTPTIPWCRRNKEDLSLNRSGHPGLHCHSWARWLIQFVSPLSVSLSFSRIHLHSIFISFFLNLLYYSCYSVLSSTKLLFSFMVFAWRLLHPQTLNQMTSMALPLQHVFRRWQTLEPHRASPFTGSHTSEYLLWWSVYWT